MSLYRTEISQRVCKYNVLHIQKAVMSFSTINYLLAAQLHVY